MEHLDKTEDGVRELNRILKPDGKIFASMPNMDSPSRRINRDSWFGYKPGHRSLLKPRQWQNTFDQFQTVTKRTSTLFCYSKQRLPRGLLFTLDTLFFLISWFPPRIGGNLIFILKKSEVRTATYSSRTATRN